MPKQITLLETPQQLAPYELLDVGNSTTCLSCGQPVWLLVPKSLGDFAALPAFGVCFKCQTIGQMAVGPVPKVSAYP